MMMKPWNDFFKYSPFHKTLPKSSLRMHWISVRFYEISIFKGKIKMLIIDNDTNNWWDNKNFMYVYIIIYIYQ